jgi:hypothetical protein
VTTVCVAVECVVRAGRSMCPSLLDDLTNADWTYEVTASVFTVTLDADLDAATCEKIRDRLVTPDAAAEARRAQLRADRDALAEDDPLRRLYDEVLGH